MSEGRYRIQAVAELTGVPASTLRQWERRYGIPSPARTGAAYRLYGGDDIDDIRRMQALCASGLSPAEASRILRSEARPVAAGVTAGPVSVAAGPVAAPVTAAPVAAAPALMDDDLDPYQAARRRIMAAVERYDHDDLHEMGRRLLYMGSAVAVFERVVAPVMREVGERWHAGTLSVAQEHLVSEVLGQLAQQLLPIVQPDESERVVLLACSRDELHTLPLYGIAFRLAQWRYRSVVLGARTPPEALAAAVAHIEPALVGLSLTMAPGVEDAKQLMAGYAEACGEVPWVVGGRGAEAVAARVVAAGGWVAPCDPGELEALLGRLKGSGRGRSR